MAMELNVAVLDLGVPPSCVMERWGNYSAMFQTWLSLSTKDSPALHFDVFNSRLGEYPPNERGYDLYIFTGSEASVYEEDQWIRQAEEYVRYLDSQKRKALFVCFGHQLVCVALGGRVIKNPNGWELSAVTYDLTENGKQFFGKEKMSLQQSHQDCVVSFPEDFVLLGGNQHTHCHSVAKGNHFLSLQGHPEFDADINGSLLEMKRAKGLITEEQYTEAKGRLHNPTDSVLIAQRVIEWMKEK